MKKLNYILKANKINYINKTVYSCKLIYIDSFYFRGKDGRTFNICYYFKHANFFKPTNFFKTRF